MGTLLQPIKTCNDLQNINEPRIKRPGIQKAKRKFERCMAKDVKSNPRSFYAYVRSKTKVKEIVGPLRKYDGNYVSDNEEIGNVLNDYFGSVFTDEKDLDNLPEVQTVFREDNSHMLK